MERKSKTEKKGVDLSKMLPALDALGEPADSCLGREYDANTAECKQCADADLCLGYYKYKITEKVKERMPQLPLDVADFSRITETIQGKLLGLVRKYQDEGNCMQVEELFDTFKQLSQCADDVAVVEYLKRFILNNTLKTQNGLLMFK